MVSHLSVTPTHFKKKKLNDSDITGPVKQTFGVLKCDKFLIHQFKHVFVCSKEPSH